MSRDYRKGEIVEYVEIKRPKPSAAWHLMQVFVGTESSVAEGLKRHGFGFYAPIMRTMKTVPRKRLSAKQRKLGITIKRPEIKALFPGYMFVQFDQLDPLWPEIFKLVGVRGLWCNGNLPYRLKEDEIARIRGQEVDGAVPGQEPAGEVFGYKVGDTVRVIKGPMMFFDAVVDELPPEYDPEAPLEELDESLRVKLLISLFGRQTTMDVSFSEFAKI